MKQEITSEKQEDKIPNTKYKEAGERWELPRIRRKKGLFKTIKEYKKHQIPNIKEEETAGQKKERRGNDQVERYQQNKS